MSKLKQFSKTMVELPLHTQIKIVIKFFINYKPIFVLQKIKSLFNSSFKILVFISKILLKKRNFRKISKKRFKIKVATIFPVLVMLILQHLFFDQIQCHFLSKKYQFDKDNLYVKNISWLIFLMPKIESSFIIIALLDKIQYKFKNGAILKMPKKLVITIINFFDLLLNFQSKLCKTITDYQTNINKY